MTVSSHGEVWEVLETYIYLYMADDVLTVAELIK